MTDINTLTTSSTNTDRPLGKDYRAWLRDHNPGDEPPVAFNELLRVAMEDQPYNNRTGTWPAILINWLPYFLESKLYRQGYALIDTVFRHTKAKEDQRNWSSALEQCSTSVRRTVFRQTQGLLLDALRTSQRGRTDLEANMKHLYGDPTWIDPGWFNQWSPDKTMFVMTHTGSMANVAGAMLQVWLRVKRDRDDRIETWFNFVRKQTIESRRHELLGLFVKGWKDNTYDPNVGRAFLSRLEDDELLFVAQESNLLLKYKTHAPVAWDLVREIVRRSNYSWPLPSLTKNDEGSPKFLGLALEGMTKDWVKLSKDRRFDKNERLSLLAAMAFSNIVTSQMLEDICKRERANNNMIEFMDLMGIKDWPSARALFLKNSSTSLDLPEDNSQLDALTL